MVVLPEPELADEGEALPGVNIERHLLHRLEHPLAAGDERGAEPVGHGEIAHLEERLLAQWTAPAGSSSWTRMQRAPSTNGTGAALQAGSA